MIRKGLFVSALVAGALIGAPAQAAVRFAATSGIINQLHNNSSLTNDFQFTICNSSGNCQTQFTGVTGLRNYGNLAGLNSWANTGSYGGQGGYFDNYRPTFQGVSSFFGNNTQTPNQQQIQEDESSFSTLMMPVPEPATWGMMILGFGFIGFTMRRRQGAVSFG